MIIQLLNTPLKQKIYIKINKNKQTKKKINKNKINPGVKNRNQENTVKLDICEITSSEKLKKQKFTGR